ncbi:MAG: carboxypeptidase-like regulatory domain-containing protein, partial [Bacteroidales bacterium]|nr:carboxypeptidase-like regulatory domain-containing protein [Bacteroidales bacterium]
MNLKIHHISLLITALVLISKLPAYSFDPQTTLLRGTVTDALTGDPVSFVSVYLKGTTVGTVTDQKGSYTIETSVNATTLVFSFVGYNTEIRTIRPGREQTVDVKLTLASIALDEVIVKPERKAYRNKDNPAVELIKNVIAHKETNSPEAYDFIEYDKYEKIQFAISNISEDFKSKNSAGQFGFIFKNIDTTQRVGNNILPVFIKESISEYYYRKSPETEKEVTVAEKSINLDEYIDRKGVTAYLNYLYQDINIYDAEIFFLTSKFLSPVAATAPTFYRYYIIDTLPLNDLKCIRLFFEPRNKTDFLFHGNIYVAMDSSYAIRRIDMGINKSINIDWIQDIVISQDFERFGHDAWLLAREEIAIDVGIAKNTMGLFGQRTTYFR